MVLPRTVVTGSRDVGSESPRMLRRQSDLPLLGERAGVRILANGISRFEPLNRAEVHGEGRARRTFAPWASKQLQHVHPHFALVHRRTGRPRSGRGDRNVADPLVPPCVSPADRHCECDRRGREGMFDPIHIGCYGDGSDFRQFVAASNCASFSAAFSHLAFN
jgi:hypothetical protein